VPFFNQTLNLRGDYDVLWNAVLRRADGGGIHGLYLRENKADSRHIRKVGPWLGFMIRGIDKIKNEWWIPRSRQLHFESAGRRFKAKFDHHDGGGIDIVEIAASPGSEEIGLVYRTRCLADAERFYLLPQLSAARRSAAA
jgi:hypothetical protein